MIVLLGLFVSELLVELFYQIYLLEMLDRAITHHDTHSPLQVIQQLEWIADNERFYQQISRTLVQEMQGICSQYISAEVEVKIIQAINGFVHKISVRMKTVLQNCVLELSEQANKIREYYVEVNEKEDAIATLNQNIETLNGKISTWQTEYDTLKNQLAQTQEKYERKLKQVKRQKKEIKQTFRMVQENTEIQRALMENLQIEKGQYQEQIINEQRQKEALKGELEDIKLKYAESAHKLQASAKKMSWQEKRISHLQEVVSEKETLIIKLRQQILDSNNCEEDGQDNKSHSIVIKSFIEERHSNHQQPKKHVSFAEIFKLSDEILNIPKSFLSVKKSQDHLEVNKSLSHISQADQDIPITYTEVPIAEKSNKPQIPDFYLAHFLLTSQAMKIKMNSEIYLGIDLSQHYSQVVNQRVPFHMWDEWIRQKLKILAGI